MIVEVLHFVVGLASILLVVAELGWGLAVDLQVGGMSAEEKLAVVVLALMRIAVVTGWMQMVLGEFGEGCCMRLDPRYWEARVDQSNSKEVVKSDSSEPLVVGVPGQNLALEKRIAQEYQFVATQE